MLQPSSVQDLVKGRRLFCKISLLWQVIAFESCNLFNRTRIFSLLYENFCCSCMAFSTQCVPNKSMLQVVPTTWPSGPDVRLVHAYMKSEMSEEFLVTHNMYKSLELMSGMTWFVTLVDGHSETHAIVYKVNSKFEQLAKNFFWIAWLSVKPCALVSPFP